MKKQITCSECNGRGNITLARMYNDLCGIGCKTCPCCNGTGFHEVDMTNADRIRAMSDKELINLLAQFSSFSCIFPEMDCEETSCVDCVTKWLQQPAREE